MPPEYLTQRNGYWQFARRVPKEFAALDKRGVIKHSTKVPVAKDRRGAKASKVAFEMNCELEAYWRGLVEGRAQQAAERYAAARLRARRLGFDYAEVSELADRSTLEVLRRLETLVEKGLVEDAGARAALMGIEKRPSVRLSEVFPRFEEQTRNEVRDMSPNQLRRWRNGYMLAITGFISVVGDKALNDLTHADVLDYINWLEGRVEEVEILPKTANKQIGHNSRMIKVINLRHRLGLSDIFAGMRLEGAQQEQRPPFSTDFVQTRILAEGALLGLNEEARRTVFLMADTGLRLSEACNLNETSIFLDCAIPHIKVMPDAVALNPKTRSERSRSSDAHWKP
jgi:hypothetical protein